MDPKLQNALLQLRDEYLYFQRRAQEAQSALTTLMTQVGLKDLQVGVLSSEQPSPVQLPNDSPGR